MPQPISQHPQWLLMAEDKWNGHGSITFAQIQDIWGLSGGENGQIWAKIDKNWPEIYKILSLHLPQDPLASAMVVSGWE